RLSGANALIQNNILQHIFVTMEFEGPSEGDVIGYNLSFNWYASDFMSEDYRTHSQGDDYQLFEGNIGSEIYIEDYHGTALMETTFRNYSTGWQQCSN